MSYNIPRIRRWFVQQQAADNVFNGGNLTTPALWTSTGNQLVRIDANSVTITRNRPYSRLPVLTGTRSEQPGVVGRKAATWEIRGMPVIPSGTAGTIPDMDIILQNIFSQAAYGTGTKTYSWIPQSGPTTPDITFLPFSLLGFSHGSTTLTALALWSCMVERAVFHYNGLFLTVDLSGFAGYIADSVGFAALDVQGQGGLSAFPTEPSSPTVNGQPIAGFGTGYLSTVDSQALALKTKSLDITIETGHQPVGGLLGSPYSFPRAGGARRVSFATTFLDDDSTQLNDIKTKADTDNVTIAASFQAGTVAGSIFTMTLSTIQPNAFNLRDNNDMVDMALEESYAHASAIGNTDDATIVFS